MAAGKWDDAEVNMQKLIEATKSTGAPAGLPTEYGQLAFAYFMHGRLKKRRTLPRLRLMRRKGQA